MEYIVVEKNENNIYVSIKSKNGDVIIFTDFDVAFEIANNCNEGIVIEI